MTDQQTRTDDDTKADIAAKLVEQWREEETDYELHDRLLKDVPYDSDDPNTLTVFRANLLREFPDREWTDTEALDFLDEVQYLWDTYGSTQEGHRLMLERLDNKPRNHRRDGDKRPTPAWELDGKRLQCAGPRSHSDTTRDCRQWVAVLMGDGEMFDKRYIVNRWGAGTGDAVAYFDPDGDVWGGLRAWCRKCSTMTYFDLDGEVRHSHG